MIQKRCLVILSSLILTSQAYSQDPICTPGKPDHCVVGIEKGQVAQFSGQLMTHQMAISLGVKLELETKKLQLELEKTKTLLDIEIQKEKDLRISDNKFCEEQKKILRKQIETPFFEQPVVVAIITAAAVIGTVYVTAQIK